MEGLTAARLSTDGQVKDVRADHVARYQWASQRTSGHVIDAGCNSGYGSAILADAGLIVTALDSWAPGLDFARKHWDRPGIAWQQADFNIGFELPLASAVVAFEIIEHLANPRPLLDQAREVAGRLFASVPNESVWPHTPRLFPVHQRHYPRDEFEELLTECGWSPVEWGGQTGPVSPVEPGVNGRTIVVECQ